MSNIPDQSAFIEALLQERDELYQELSMLRQVDGGTLVIIPGNVYNDSGVKCTIQKGINL